jgi:hypothetical protein
MSADILNTKDTRTRREKLRGFFEGFDAASEQPASSCLPDMIEMYPDIKVRPVFAQGTYRDGRKIKFKSR